MSQHGFAIIALHHVPLMDHRFEVVEYIEDRLSAKLVLNLSVSARVVESLDRF